MTDSLFNPWMWLVLAAVLAGVEIFLPGAFMIWLAVAAVITAATTALLGLGAPWQLAAFALFALLSILGSKRLARRHPIASDDPALNQRGDRMVGARVVVLDAIVNGRGRVQVGDSPWQAEGPDSAPGTPMRVTAVNGALLTVERL
ncbi:NfeD family protein [Sandaracinobacteroides saxicola]|uniref:NfeD family protein n=1 Tax=Sandaracinobacteroides saxicola TaxID=2759707 RepID=A0A7G5IHA5_9SPHN|nr:NfeD family protein [Sandaracinobacteroides saxicola]QMW22747.1 NfeD family protein [Sandaracinobacteroides saxicola]